MRYFVLLGLFVSMLSACNGCDPNVSPCKHYQGDVAAVEPYDATPILDNTRDGDALSMLAVVPLHNPQDVVRTADIMCDFYLDDEVVDTDVKDGVEVCPESTVMVEMGILTMVLNETTAGVTCESFWQ
jgi:hypothetical protein